jgi:hypothetical protein
MGMRKERLEAEMKQRAIDAELEKTQTLAGVQDRNIVADQRAQDNRTEAMERVETAKIAPAVPGGESTYNFGSGGMGKPTGDVVETIRGANRTYTGFTKDKTGTYHGMEYATPWGAESLKGSAQMASEAKAGEEINKLNEEAKLQKSILGITKPAVSLDAKVASATSSSAGPYKSDVDYKPTSFVSKPIPGVAAPMPRTSYNDPETEGGLSIGKFGHDISEGLFELLDPAGDRAKRKRDKIIATPAAW